MSKTTDNFFDKIRSGEIKPEEFEEKTNELQVKLKAIEKESIIVMDGIDYFLEGRLDELKTDDVFYIKSFIRMIGLLGE